MCCYYDEITNYGEFKLKHARRDYKCCECNKQINKGDKYECFIGLLPGEGWYALHTCLDCSELRNKIHKIENQSESGRMDKGAVS